MIDESSFPAKVIYQPPSPMHPLVHRFLDFIYPAYCHLCETPLSHGRHLCKVCNDKLHRIEPPFCQRCGECFDGQIAGEFTCPNCTTMKLHFEFARATLHSEDGGRRLIHDFKYLREIQLAKELARLARPALADPRFSPYLKNGYLVPVPLFWKRQHKRQFNQSEHIARHLSNDLGPESKVPVINALQRIRHTQTQTRLSRTKRMKNLNGAFTIHKKHLPALQNKPVILIDDVFTTGSTVNECSRVLLDQGASQVAVLTVLRG